MKSKMKLEDDLSDSESDYYILENFYKKSIKLFLILIILLFLFTIFI